MSTFIELIRAIVRSLDSPHEPDEAYLAAAVDIQDLERRMRAIDSRGRQVPTDVALGVGLW